MELPADPPVVIATVTAMASLLVACGALAWTIAIRRRMRKTEDTVRRIETGRTRALSSAEHLLSAMQRLAEGYRTLAVSLRSSATVMPGSVQEIATARQDVEKERAVAQLYWPAGVDLHVKEVAAIADNLDADAKVLDEKADKIEQHGAETAELFKTRYMEPPS
jgi:hypothetical protein